MVTWDNYLGQYVTLCVRVYHQSTWFSAIPTSSNTVRQRRSIIFLQEEEEVVVVVGAAALRAGVWCDCCFDFVPCFSTGLKNSVLAGGDVWKVVVRGMSANVGCCSSAAPTLSSLRVSLWAGHTVYTLVYCLTDQTVTQSVLQSNNVDSPEDHCQFWSGGLMVSKCLVDVTPSYSLSTFLSADCAETKQRKCV